MKVGRSDLDQEHRREQIEEYNILDFSNWQDGVYFDFDRMERRLVKGIDLLYKEKEVFGPTCPVDPSTQRLLTPLR
jgi:hypothetical protein